MKSAEQLAGNDLSLVFDAGGRLWRFRPATSARDPQPVAFVADGALVIAVRLPGARPGDVDVHVSGDVLEIRGKATRTTDLVLDIGLPRRVDLDELETAHNHEVFEVRVPAAATVETPSVEPVAVAV
jgi:HSP20 family molecular chaperone IbpA